MKLGTIIVTLGAAIALSAPAMALEPRPGLSKQTLDAYYQTSKNLTFLRHRAVSLRQIKDYRVAAVKVRVRVK